jgi:hypothetical protein
MGWLGYYKAVNTSATAQAYSNVFLICALLTGVGIVLAAFMRKPEPHADAVVEANPEAIAGAEALPTEQPDGASEPLALPVPEPAMSGLIAGQEPEPGSNEPAHCPAKVAS